MRVTALINISGERASRLHFGLNESGNVATVDKGSGRIPAHTNTSHYDIDSALGNNIPEKMRSAAADKLILGSVTHSCISLPQNADMSTYLADAEYASSASAADVPNSTRMLNSLGALGDGIFQGLALNDAMNFYEAGDKVSARNLC